MTTTSRPGSQASVGSSSGATRSFSGRPSRAAIELGRAVAPLCLVDEATLGVPLAVGGRVRHGEGRVEGGEREPTLDGTGTLRGVEAALPSEAARLQAWGAVTLAYLAGLADGALVKAVRACKGPRAVRGAACRAAGSAGAARRRGARP